MPAKHPSSCKIYIDCTPVLISMQSRQTAKLYTFENKIKANTKIDAHYTSIQRKVNMNNNKNRIKDRPKSGPELRKMKPKENSDVGIINGRKLGMHSCGHEKGSEAEK